MILDFSKTIDLKAIHAQSPYENKIVDFLVEWFSTSTSVHNK